MSSSVTAPPLSWPFLTLAWPGRPARTRASSLLPPWVSERPTTCPLRSWITDRRHTGIPSTSGPWERLDIRSGWEVAFQTETLLVTQLRSKRNSFFNKRILHMKPSGERLFSEILTANNIKNRQLLNFLKRCMAWAPEDRIRREEILGSTVRVFGAKV